MLEERRLLDLIDEMRVSVPENVAEAQRLVEQRERILSEAEDEAHHTIAAAQEEASRRITESEITKSAEAHGQAILAAAQQRAEAIVAEANKQIAQRRGEADDYALDVLRRLESHLDTLRNSVRRGIEALEENKGS